MLQIRRGVYETNSSSSHSIIIKKKDRPIVKVTDPGWRMYIDEDDENNPRNGVIKFDDRDLEFGRDSEDTVDTEDVRMTTKQWKCQVCGYVYEGHIPDDFVCPICGVDAGQFQRLQ